ncbi:MAG: thymidylate kinase [Acidimicrobiia bacterium]|nr:thymidylate kinase [Acidimicrobiia bacterium]
MSALGRFIVFEGGDGGGKSTQARLLASDLGALPTREPGGTVLGERLREALLDPATGDIGAKTEALLMAAARAQHVTEVIRPALASGRHVVCDRYSHSSIAYQSGGRGLKFREIEGLSDWATEGLWPDLVIQLEVSTAVAQARLGAKLDRFEAAGADFHERVEQTYRDLAGRNSERWVVISGDGSIGEVQARVRAAVQERLGL